MKLITFAGPPASGKTTVLIKLAHSLIQEGARVGAVKFDCLQTDDDRLYKAAGIPAIKGLSAELCPDHFFISNIEDVCRWGEKQGFDWLFTESAGLCNRCSPYLRHIPAVCVIDQLSGIHAPRKLGPMLKLADTIFITKGDIVSQAEREVFYRQVQLVNPRAEICCINGLTGQGITAARQILTTAATEQEDILEQTLRFPMPMALCSYCLGETRVGEEYQIGNVKKINTGGV